MVSFILFIVYFDYFSKNPYTFLKWTSEFEGRTMTYQENVTMHNTTLVSSPRSELQVKGPVVTNRTSESNAKRTPSRTPSYYYFSGKQITGCLGTFRYDSSRPALFEEIDIDTPEEYHPSSFNNVTKYEYSYYDASIQNVHEYYRFSIGSYEIPKRKHFTYLSLPKFNSLGEMFNPYKLVLLIKSRPSSWGLRQAIRSTYGNTAVIPSIYGKAKLYFLVGLDATTDYSTKLRTEQSTHNDMIVMNIVDSFQNVTLKVLLAEDLFVLAHARTPYVLLGDDDTCINVLKIMKLLPSLPKSKYTLGKCAYNKIGSTNPHSKHGVTLNSMPNRIAFQIGNLMIMTNDLIYDHIHYARRVPALSHIDDGQLGVFHNMVGAKIDCQEFYVGLRTKPIEGYIHNITSYGVHYCKRAFIMKSVCKNVNL